ncbi:uncharacterized protein METZ01_LOCUS48399 [marine metagenome]|uniref:Uncharacterized protein n=1 Tax=marine metagenome TaxID=408172 RepID=A0A381RUI5_9ZZZZ
MAGYIILQHNGRRYFVYVLSSRA